MVSAGDVGEGIAQRYGVWDKDRFWSIEDWKKHLIKSRGKSKWGIVPQKVINSCAYFDLSTSGKVALIAAYNIAGREKISLTTGDKRKRKLSEYRYLPFCLPLNLLRATGFGCDLTCINAIKQLIEYGFIEVVTKYKGQATVYRMSDSYLEYQPLT